MKKSKKTVYDVITDRILALLEEGIAPWQKPWTVRCYEGHGCGSFFNLKSKRAYRGSNVAVLAARWAGCGCPFFVTYNQAKAMGGQVKAGEKGTPVVKWMVWEKKERVGDEDVVTKRIPYLQYFTVFNVAEQCTGLEGKLPKEITSDKPEGFTPVQAAAEIVDGMPNRPPVTHGGSKACYSPYFDRVNMPKPEDFRGREFYYKTLFHELGHSTGHVSRLHRPLMGQTEDYDPSDYAFEELVAEMTAAFLCGSAGIGEEVFENSAAYIDHWRSELSKDPKLVVRAAAAAQKAADYILGTKVEAREEEPVAEEVTA